MDNLAMRGSGELLFQLKARNLSLQDLTVFAELLWAANSHGEVQTYKYPVESVKNLLKLNFCVKINEDTVLLNPHVTQCGGTDSKRGQLRLRFRNLKAR